MLPVSTTKRQIVWEEMKRHLVRHNKYVKEKRNEQSILAEYYYCMGMVYAMRELGIMDENKLREYEGKLYKPYVQK